MDVRMKICEMCTLAYNKGMVTGTGGNISALDGDKIWITPTGYSLADIRPEDLVAVGLDGNYQSEVKPSKEVTMHLLAYQARPETRAVIHLHSYYSIRVGLGIDPNDDPMPPYTVSYARKVGRVGMVPPFKSGTAELAKAVEAELAKFPVVLLQNHGILAVGNSLRAAMNYCEDTEFNARMHLEQRGVGALHLG